MRGPGRAGARRAAAAARSGMTAGSRAADTRSTPPAARSGMTPGTPRQTAQRDGLSRRKHGHRIGGHDLPHGHRAQPGLQRRPLAFRSGCADQEPAEKDEPQPAVVAPGQDQERSHYDEGPPEHLPGPRGPDRGLEPVPGWRATGRPAATARRPAALPGCKQRHGHQHAVTLAARIPDAWETRNCRQAGDTPAWCRLEPGGGQDPADRSGADAVIPEAKEVLGCAVPARGFCLASGGTGSRISSGTGGRPVVFG